MNNRTTNILPDLPGIFAFILFLVTIGLAGTNSIGDGDTLWHIRAGTTMLETGELLTHDIFSHTAYGKPWIAHEWGAEIVMGALHLFGGLSAVGIFYLLLVALTFWLLARIAERFAGPWVLFVSIAMALVLVKSHLLLRPHIFTWFLGVLTLYLLLRNDRTLYLLVPVTALWSNLHGGVLLGPALQGIFILGHFLDQWPQSRKNLQGFLRENRRPISVFALSIAALGANPFGYHLIFFHFQVTREVFTANISEWLSPNLQEMWLFRIYLLATLLVLSLSATRTSWTDRILLLFFLNAAFVHQRHISLAALFLTPFWAKSLQTYARKLSVRRPAREPNKELSLSPKSGPIVTTGLALMLLTATGTASGQQTLKEFFSLPDYFSEGAIRFLENTPVTDRVFNDYMFGGYIIYALGPERKVFIDGRADMYGEKIFGDYLKIRDLEESDALLDAYEIDWVLFPDEHPLVSYLTKGGGWSEAYRDEKVAILSRKNLATCANRASHSLRSGRPERAKPKVF